MLSRHSFSRAVRSVTAEDRSREGEGEGGGGALNGGQGGGAAHNRQSADSYLSKALFDSEGLSSANVGHNLMAVASCGQVGTLLSLIAMVGLSL